MKQKRTFLFTLLATAGLGLPPAIWAQSNANRGLWVGEVLLDRVNEVVVPLDKNNVPKAPDPNVPTKTFDTASLRLILHVDGTGQVRLLKNVAVLSRTGGEVSSTSEMALVTEKGLYGVFPPQAATRIASAVFDFGDSKATDAVRKIVEAASTAARDAVVAGNTEAEAKTAATNAATPILTQANVVQSFDAFLAGAGNRAKVTDIADGAPADAAATMLAAAEALKAGAFYQDSRGVEMVAAIQAAITPHPTTAAKIRAALNTAASFADIADNYERFLVGQRFGAMIDAAAEVMGNSVAAAPVKQITAFEGTDGSFPVKVTSAAHGLGTGEEIALFGSSVGAYNKLWTVTRVDDNAFLIQLPFVAGQPISNYAARLQSGPLRITSLAHGLSSGGKVTIKGAGIASYNGTFVVTKLDNDTFSIPAVFDANPVQKGTWSNRNGVITGYEGTADGAAGVKIVSPAHGLTNGQEIELTGSGKASYNGVKMISRIDNDSFSIVQAFDGNPAVKGSWTIPMAISSYAPPAQVSTLVVSAGHGLTTGDRITIANSGNAGHLGEHAVEVVNADTFSINFPWVDATGNPAVKGNWTPVLGGSWRRVAPIRTAITNSIPINDAKTEALQIQIAAYNDTRATDAINVVLEAMIAAAATSPPSAASQIANETETAGRAALDQKVVRYAQPTLRPTPDYNAFVRSAAYLGSVETAASAASAAAMFEKTNNSLWTNQSVFDKAMQAAINALRDVYSAAARAVRPELPLTGGFGPGKTNLTGTVFLPANHPTNPFRHRRHPDHSVGFDITRILKLSFDGNEGDALAPAGYGVERIKGVYEEEIIGLHKPLGPSQNIGLKVKGTFQLHRVSLIDTLNGR